MPINKELVINEDLRPVSDEVFEAQNIVIISQPGSANTALKECTDILACCTLCACCMDAWLQCFQLCC